VFINFDSDYGIIWKHFIDKKILSQLSIKITHIDLLLINKHVIYLNKALLIFVVIETLRQPIRCVYHCNIMKVFILEGVRMFWSLYCIYEPSWSGSYGNWIYNYLCNQCLSPLTLWIRIQIMARCTRYNIMLSSLTGTCDRSVVFYLYSCFLHQ
jgi:hypothetical protein